MNIELMVVTVVSSLISVLVGVAVAAWFFYKIERHKPKLDLARRLLGNRYSVAGDNFSCAVNEVMVVFADTPEVLEKTERLYEVLQAHGKPNADGALVDFLKSVCKGAGLTQSTLNDTYFIKTFNARN